MIIGITGTNGAGKGEIVELLKSYGFRQYSVRELLVQELERRGIPVNRDNLVKMGNEFREKNSPSFLIEQLYEKARINGGNSIIESIRTLGELYALRAKGNFYLISVDASPFLRYNRILRRNKPTDEVSFEKFLEQDRAEMNSPNNSFSLP